MKKPPFKKVKNILIIIVVIPIFISCHLFEFEDSLQPREFVFKNYTTIEYNDSRIYLGEILDDETIKIHKTEHIDISSKTEDSEYYEISTEKSEDWDKVIHTFMENGNDYGCFIFELSDKRKIYIEITYIEDGIFSGISYIDDLLEIIIEDEAFTTSLSTDKLNNIPVEQYSILY